MCYTETSSFIKSNLEKLGLKRRELAVAMGYKNISKGTGHIDRWLRGYECPIKGQIAMLSKGLNVSEEEIKKVISIDRHRNGLQKLKEAIETLQRRYEDPRYYVVARVIPAVYLRSVFPSHYTIEQIVQEVSERYCPLKPHFKIYTREYNIYYVDEKREVTFHKNKFLQLLEEAYIDTFVQIPKTYIKGRKGVNSINVLGLFDGSLPVVVEKLE